MFPEKGEPNMSLFDDNLVEEARAEEVMLDPEDVKDKEANDIVRRLMSNKPDTDHFQMASRKMGRDLILELYKQKDKAPILNMSLVMIAEQIVLLNHVTGNLQEAVEVLRQHNIPFDTILAERSEGDE